MTRKHLIIIAIAIILSLLWAVWLSIDSTVDDEPEDGYEFVSVIT